MIGKDILVPAHQRARFGRIAPGGELRKGSEFTGKMRLIGVTQIMRQAGEAEPTLAEDLLLGNLEARDAGQQLGRHAHLHLELTLQLANREPDCFGERADFALPARFEQTLGGFQKITIFAERSNHGKFREIMNRSPTKKSRIL